MELDLYNEIIEFYTKNKDVKEFQNWEELLLKSKKWYNVNFTENKVIGDDVLLESDIRLTDIHCSDDFCFGFEDKILFYRSFLLFQGSQKFRFYLKVNYSNYGSIGLSVLGRNTRRYYSKGYVAFYNKGYVDFKGIQLVSRDIKVLDKLHRLIRNRYKPLEEEKKKKESELARIKNEEELRKKERIKEEKRRKEQERIKKLEKTRNKVLSS